MSSLAFSEENPWADPALLICAFISLMKFVSLLFSKGLAPGNTTSYTPQHAY